MRNSTTTLNSEQQRAVESDSMRILCLAGAGTGKTHTMISRICNLVDNGVSPTNILALTFTNAAAFEMQERFKKMSGRMDSPEFRTFHGFCYSLIASDIQVRKAIGYDNVPEIVDEKVVKTIESKCKDDLGIKVSKEVLESSVKPGDANLAKLLNKLIRRTLNRRNIITFDILCYDVCQLFVNNDPRCERYKRKYHHIFVDEFQDTDPKQWMFVSSFNNSNLFLVGDALQAIYAFRGADSSIIKELSKDSNWEVIKLIRNYRSTKAICEAANKLGEAYADPDYRVEMVSNRDQGDTVVVHDTNQCKYATYNQVDTILADWQKHDEPECAILCRTNKEVDFIAKVLGEREIPFVKKSKDDSIIHFLKSIGNDEYAFYWLISLMRKEKQANFLRLELLVDEDRNDFSKKLDRLIRYSGNQEIQDWLWKLDDANTAVDENNGMRLLEIIRSIDRKAVRNNSEAIQSKSIGEAIQCMIQAVEAEEPEKVYIGTIHSSKGLEYDTVYIVNAGSPLFRLNGEENLNLFYVGITRAKNRLIMV